MEEIVRYELNVRKKSIKMKTLFKKNAGVKSEEGVVSDR